VRGTIKIKREIRIKGKRRKSGGKDALTTLYPWTRAEPVSTAVGSGLSG